MKVTGIIPPLLTPFDEAGHVDEARLCGLVAFLRPYVNGLFVCGSYGSGPLMSPDERQRVLEVVLKAVNESMPVIAQVGSADTASALRLAQHAEAHGAAAVAAVPPYYYLQIEPALLEYYQAIIRSVSIPVYAYDNPKTTGNPLSPKLLNALAEAGLAGVKDSSFDIGKLYTAMRMVKQPSFDFVIGSESLMLPAFVMGVRGCVAGLANVFPEAMARFYQAAISGDPEQAQKRQMQVLKLWDVLHIGPSVPTAYAILNLRGIDSGTPRRPFLPLSGDLLDQVRQALADLQEVWDPECW